MSSPGDARIVIEGGRFTSLGMGAVYEGTLQLDPSVKPAYIDMKFEKGPEAGNTNLGIYEFKGDSWMLCIATRGTVRPATFASAPGSGIAVEKLVRGKAAPKPRKVKVAEPSGPATEFEGEWQMLTGVMDGKAMDAATVQWVKRVTRGNQTTVMAGPQTMIKVEFTFDPATSPPSIDYLNLHGSAKGKRQQGIYRFEGDVLTFCVASPGAPRPGEFSSVPGDGRTLTAWKR
jgi:uncharacterized protein (TIGR03067 family)